MYHEGVVYVTEERNLLVSAQTRQVYSFQLSRSSNVLLELPACANSLIVNSLGREREKKRGGEREREIGRREERER